MDPQTSSKIRSTPIAEWPAADQAAWAAACRPAERLQRGGAAAHMKEITRADLARRYGYFLDYLDRQGELDCAAGPAGQVTPEAVARYQEELAARVSSVTLQGSIYKLRRAADVLAPDRNFSWLAEIENDLALTMRPKSKFSRTVDADRLVRAGLALVAEADLSEDRPELKRAVLARNGLMVALLACAPLRLKNFTGLELGRSFRHAATGWWIVLGRNETKSGRPDERRVPDFLTPSIEVYLARWRPVLLARKGRAALETLSFGQGERDSGPATDPPKGAARLHGPLWVSANAGMALSYSGIEAVLTQTTRAALGIAVSAHLFRTAAASTAYLHCSDNPRLAAALLQHTDPRVTEEHYNRASSHAAALTYARVLEGLK